jgi:putative serine protease PepD
VGVGDRFWNDVDSDGDRGMINEGVAGEVVVNGRSVPLSARVRIGRAPDNDIVLDDDRVSRHHAVLELDDGLKVTDLGSSNGTFVGGVALRSQSAPLHDGDQLRIGGTEMSIKLAVPSPPPPDEERTVISPRPRAVNPPAAPAPRGEPAPPNAAQPTPAAVPVRPEPAPQQSRIVQVSRSVVGSPSTVIRQLQRNSRRTTAVAVVAVLVAIGVGVSAAAGLFSSSPPTAAQVAQAVAPSTVLVWGYDGQSVNSVIENGSGWVLAANKGLIVTNDHVAEGAESLRVAVGTAPGATVASDRRPATIVGADPCEDIALLKVADTSGLKTLPLGSQSTLHAGDSVVALGFPDIAARAMNFQNAALIVTSGTVSSPMTQFDAGGDEANLPNVVQTDTVINHGNSGGPLVNDNSQLVGMNTATYPGSSGNVSGENYAIGVNRIKTLIRRLERGSIGTAGFILDPGLITQASSTVNGLPSGIAVEGAVSGTPASQLRVHYYGGNSPPYSATNPPPDVLTQINGKPLSDSKDSYCSAVQALAPGQTATVHMAVPGLNGLGQIQYTTGSFQVRFAS